jgi:hypothetical protein
MKISFDEYVKIDALNNSKLKKILQSPYHFKNAKEFEKTEAMNFGSAVHLAILESHLIESQFCQSPKFDKRTKQGKEDFAKFEADNQGKLILTEDEMNQVMDIKNKVKDNSFIQSMLKDCVFEETILVDYQGLKMKSRLDGLSSKCIIDVKTTSDASIRGFSSSIVKFGYDFLAYSFYLHCDRKGI